VDVIVKLKKKNKKMSIHSLGVKNQKKQKHWKMKNTKTKQNDKNWCEWISVRLFLQKGGFLLETPKNQD
jgi:hypothetical protein